jgi:acetylornithine/succinyldiaminopimelate/putrescine aminotransferase
VLLLQEAGILTVPAGTQVIRLLPPLNLLQEQAVEAMQTIETVFERIATRVPSAA